MLSYEFSVCLIYYLSQKNYKKIRFIMKFVYFRVQMCISCTFYSDHSWYTKFFVYLTCMVRVYTKQFGSCTCSTTGKQNWNSSNLGLECSTRKHKSIRCELFARSNCTTDKIGKSTHKHAVVVQCLVMKPLSLLLRNGLSGVCPWAHAKYQHL